MRGFLNRVGGGKSDSGGDADKSSASSAAKRASTDGVIKGEGAPKAIGGKGKRGMMKNRKQQQVIKDLPLLSETPMLKREALFRQKLQLCHVIFDCEDFEGQDVKGREIKRETLVELAEYINSPVGQKILTEALMPDIVEMARINLFRTLPPPTEDFDPEEDEPQMEPQWPHLQLVYELFLRFIVSTEVNGKVAKKYVDQSFLRQWIELFDAEDPRFVPPPHHPFLFFALIHPLTLDIMTPFTHHRERDYVKTVLHRMYGKFMSHRSFIRKAISQVFFRYIYETGRYNGIGELLEILGSIINGFAIPLKKEHLQFLERALIPLHKTRGVALYHPQLSYCISQYVEKDPDTIVPIVRGLIRFWPWSSAFKQVLFLNEVEEILELCRPEQLSLVQDDFAYLLSACLSSPHFQVTERALYYWNSENLCSNVLSQAKAASLLPLVFAPLSRSAQGHWNQTVEGLAQSVLKVSP